MEEQLTAHKGTDQEDAPGARNKRRFVRLNYAERMQHVIFFSCFVLLAITGLMLKVPEETVVKTLGAAREPVFYYRGIVHRTAATIMMLTSLYHIYYLIFKPTGRRWLLDMLPRPKDVTDLIGNMLYYLGIKKAPPQFDRFSYKEKMEYGALIAGNTLMTLTGLILWTETLWNRFVLDLSTIVHGMEAVLACLAIMVWHLYQVHLRPNNFPMSRVWIDGVLDEEEMKKEHPLHYEKIMGDPNLREMYLKKEG